MGKTNQRLKIKRSIAFKVSIVISLAIFVIMGIGFYFLIGMQRAAIKKNINDYFVSIYEMVVSAIREQHTQNGILPSKQIREIMRSHKEILSSNISNYHGVIKWASNPSDVGKINKIVSDYKREWIGGEKANIKMLEHKNSTQIVVPILPEQACFRCHQERKEPIGFFFAESISLSTLFSDVYKFSTVSFLIILLTILATLIILSLAIRYYVVKPINTLLNMIEAVEKGNFLVRAEVKTADELGILSSGFNNMLKKITDLMVSQLEHEREVVAIQQELKYKEQIEEKSRRIFEINSSLERKLNELSLLFELSSALNSSLELDDTLESLIKILQEKMNYLELAVLLWDEEDRVLKVKRAFGYDNEEQLKNMTFKPGEGISGRVVESGEMILVNDTTNDPRFLHYKGKKIIDGSFLSIPMKFKGEIIGVLNFSRPGINMFKEEEVELLKAVANQAAIAIKNAELYQKTLELSITDSLTGLYNRRYFFKRFGEVVDSSIRYNTGFAILMIDIDHFKSFNDTYGHKVGDEILKKIAYIFSSRVRKVDIVARYGGEEFVILFPRIKKKEAVDLGEKLRKNVELSKFIFDGEPIEQKITVSVGVAVFPEDSNNAREIIELADKALYEAKRRGRNQTVAYESNLNV
ncbi:MAG: diguanylate cyclase [Deltaproteobacteria bacterium]|nr:diguanylate cyclase [Deltaproteobacteria bacterium]